MDTYAVTIVFKSEEDAAWVYKFAQRMAQEGKRLGALQHGIMADAITRAEGVTMAVLGAGGAAQIK